MPCLHLSVFWALVGDSALGVRRGVCVFYLWMLVALACLRVFCFSYTLLKSVFIVLYLMYNLRRSPNPEAEMLELSGDELVLFMPLDFGSKNLVSI